MWPLFISPCFHIQPLIYSPCFSLWTPEGSGGADRTQGGFVFPWLTPSLPNTLRSSDEWHQCWHDRHQAIGEGPQEVYWRPCSYGCVWWCRETAIAMGSLFRLVYWSYGCVWWSRETAVAMGILFRLVYWCPCSYGCVWWCRETAIAMGSLFRLEWTHCLESSHEV